MPVYGSKMETEGPSAMLIVKVLVHAATMHTDATVLRDGTGGCGAGDSDTTAFSSHAGGVSVPRGVGVFPFRVVADDDDSGVENMGENLQKRQRNTNRPSSLGCKSPRESSYQNTLLRDDRGDTVQCTLETESDSSEDGIDFSALAIDETFAAGRMHHRIMRHHVEWRSHFMKRMG